MCLAINNKKGGAKLSAQLFERTWNSNPDGGGLAYMVGEKMVIKKTMTKDNFYKLYETAYNVSTSDILVHWRFATHGKKNLQNTHPFMVNVNTAFIHNGMMFQKELQCPDGQNSDTAMLCEALKLSSLSMHELLPRVEKYVGSANKLIFLHEGETFILNEKQGVWNEGNWYSKNIFYTYKRYEYSALLGSKKQNKGIIKSGKAIKLKDCECDFCNEITKTKLRGNYEVCDKCETNYFNNKT